MCSDKLEEQEKACERLPGHLDCVSHVTEWAESNNCTVAKLLHDEAENISLLISHEKVGESLSLSPPHRSALVGASASLGWGARISIGRQKAKRILIEEDSINNCTRTHSSHGDPSLQRDQSATELEKQFRYALTGVLHIAWGSIGGKSGLANQIAPTCLWLHRGTVRRSTHLIPPPSENDDLGLVEVLLSDSSLPVACPVGSSF